MPGVSAPGTGRRVECGIVKRIWTQVQDPGQEPGPLDTGQDMTRGPCHDKRWKARKNPESIDLWGAGAGHARRDGRTA